MRKRMATGIMFLAMCSMSWGETVNVTAISSGALNNGNLTAPVDMAYFAFLGGGSDGVTHRGLLKFPSIPAIVGKKIDSAVLHMNYCYGGGANPNLPLMVCIFMLEQSWDATTTWANQPAIHSGGGPVGSIVESGTSLPVSPNGWNTWNVKEALQHWADGLGNTCLEVRGDEGLVVVNPGWQVLKYIYQANQVGNEPWLEITYHTPLPGEGEATITSISAGNIDNSEINRPIDQSYFGMVAGYSDGVTRRAFVKFPAVTTLLGKQIDKAILHMNYCWSDGAASSLPLTVRLYMLESDWDASTTWANQPGIHAGSGFEGETSDLWLAGSPSGWNNWDVKEAVQQWADGLNNTSLGIRGDETFVSQNPGWMVIKFLYQANQTGNAPWIEVVYHNKRTPGDASGDGRVDVSDLGILAANYGTTSGATWEKGDFSGDGIVDVSDLGILAANYGTGTGGTLDFAKDAKALGLVVGESETTKAADNPVTQTPGGCGSAGLPLIAGLLLAGLSLVGGNKLEE